jgi:DeoR family L-fucose operon activator
MALKKEDRRQNILSVLSERESINTQELASLMDVSLVTLRRDLRDLQKSGLVINGYGVVRAVNQETDPNSFFLKRLRLAREAKERIAAKAIEFVEENDVLFIDESTTCYVFALKLSRAFKKLHIITNGINILLALSKVQGFSVESSGGSLQYGFDSLIGPRAESLVGSIYANKLFFSCASLRKKIGTFELSPFSASIKRKMLLNSSAKILLVDNSKFDVIAPFKMAEIDEIDRVITEDRDFLPSEAI